MDLAHVKISGDLYNVSFGHILLVSLLYFAFPVTCYVVPNGAGGHDNHGGPFPLQATELRTFFESNGELYIGLAPNETDQQTQNLSTTQLDCPSLSDSAWFSNPEINRRAMCPWVWEQKDNGEDIVPRYLKQAKCLCPSCVGATSLSCNEERRPVSVLRKLRSEDGLVLMQRDNVTITTSCFCARPIRSGAN